MILIRSITLLKCSNINPTLRFPPPPHQEYFEQVFAQQYATIHRLETNKLRNVAKLFAHLLYADAVPWTVFEVGMWGRRPRGFELCCAHSCLPACPRYPAYPT